MSRMLSRAPLPVLSVLAALSIVAVLAPPAALSAQQPSSSSNDPWDSTNLRNQVRVLSPDELRAVRAKADAGGAREQFMIGLAYEYGLAGVPRDVAEALRWHTRVAEQGIGMAEAWVGDFYYDGLGMPRDFERALYWYRRGSDHNFGLATRFIGDFQLYGQALPRNPSEAATWYAKAASQGDAAGRARLAVLTPPCADDFCAVLRTIIISRENGFQDLRGEGRDDRVKDAFVGKLKPAEADSCDITPADAILRLGATYECEFRAPFEQLTQKLQASLPAGWTVQSEGPGQLHAGPTPSEGVVMLSGFWLKVLAPYR
jgi:Sel1 repeat-containing protein